MRIFVFLCCVAVGAIGCGEPITDLDTSSNPAATGTSTPVKPVQSATKPPPPETVIDEIKAFRGARPVLIALTSNRDALKQKLSEAQAELQAKNVAVYIVYDIDRAYRQGERGSGSALSERDANELADIYGKGPSGITWALIDQTGETVFHGKENLTVSEVLAKLPGS